MSNLISKTELAKILNCCRTTLWRFERDGLLPDAIVLDETFLGYRKDSVEQWLTDNTFKNVQSENQREKRGSRSNLHLWEKKENAEVFKLDCHDCQDLVESIESDGSIEAEVT